MTRGQFRVLPGGSAVPAQPSLAVDPMVFHASCLEAYEASQVARGFSQTTMDNWSGVLDRFLAACGRPAWEVTREDVDRVVAGLVAQGLAASTRRGYVQAFKGFHAFLAARKATEIEAAFGVRLVDPVDEFNAARHVGADSPRPSRRRARSGWRTSSTSSRIGSRPPASTWRLVGTTRCSALCIWLGYGRRRPHRSIDRTCTSAVAVRQAARPVRQRCQDLRAASPLGADARRARSDPALVPGRDPAPTRGRVGVVLRRERWAYPPRHHPQPTGAPARS